MGKSSIFLSEVELGKLFRNNSKSGDYLKGIAYSFDSNSVFHGYIKKPVLKTSSINYICYFLFVLPEDIKSSKSKLIDDFIDNVLETENRINFVVVCLTLENNKLIQKAFFVSENNKFELSVKYIPKTGDLYSRSKGLIENDVLFDKKIGIIGLGSGGSQVAIELAKAGIGNFYLYDFDKLELSNISRHICGMDDIGRYKTLAVKDAILNKNPNANVNTFEIDVNKDLEVFADSIKDVNLIVCASDTIRSRFNINQLSISYNIISLFGRAITRAAGGDVLRVRPKSGPCLNCLFDQGVIGKEQEEYSQIRQIKEELPAYTTESEINTIIQVGLSSDILPISTMMVKLALVELGRGKKTGISSLEEDLTADFYIWANRREKIYSEWPKMEYNYNKQTILRWYGARVNRDVNCLVCGDMVNENNKDSIFN